MDSLDCHSTMTRGVDAAPAIEPCTFLGTNYHYLALHIHAAAAPLRILPTFST